MNTERFCIVVYFFNLTFNFLYVYRFKIHMVLLKKKGDGSTNASFVSLDLMLEGEKYGKSKDIHKKAKAEVGLIFKLKS